MIDSPAAIVALTACPVCGETSSCVLGERSDGIEVLECLRCRMGRVAQRPLDTAAYYSDSYYLSDEAGAEGYSDYTLVAAHSLAWAAELIHLLRAGGKVLDVGCADGHLLQQLGPSYETFGIEVNEHLRRHCARAGIRMLGADIGDDSLPVLYGGSFDVISAIAVLEHVPDIRAALARIRSLLAPEGVLLFEVPLVSPTRDNQVWFNSSLEHIYYPTPEGLAFLFEDVFGLPLIGREVPIQGYGSTFFGLATPSPGMHRELAAFLENLIDSPVADLKRPERAFRFFFDLVHAAAPTPETIAVLAELDPAKVSPELLHRLAVLWNLDLSPESQRTNIESLRRALSASDGLQRKMTAEIAERNQTLLAASVEIERLRADLQAIHSSRSWRTVVRVWRFRIALRRGLQGLRGQGLGTGVWRTARFAYRLLPLSGRARYRLRGKVLAWLSVADETPPDVAVSRLRDQVQRLTWRRAGTAMTLLLRGDLARSSCT